MIEINRLFKSILILLHFIVIGITITTNVNAQEIIPLIIKVNEHVGSDLSHKGIDTTDEVRLRGLIDTSSAVLSTGAAVFLAQRGQRSIDSITKFRYQNALNKYLSFPADYLYALSLIQDPDVHQMTLDYLDTLISNRGNNISSYYRDMEINYSIELLILMNDYSKFSLYASLIEGRNVNPFYFNNIVLLEFSQKDQLKDSVYHVLKTIISNGALKERLNALVLLYNFSDLSDLRIYLKNIFVSDTTAEIRSTAIGMLNRLYADPFVLTASKEIALSTQDSMVFRGVIADIQYFHSPLGLVTLEEIKNSLQSGYFLDWVNYTIQNFYPAVLPYPITNISTAIDTLIFYKEQAMNLNWLGDNNFVTELDSHLTAAKNYFQQGDSNNCDRQLRYFKQKIKEEYQDSSDGDTKFVKFEAWAYLYRIVQNIRHYLPTPPPQYNLNTNTTGNGTVTKSPELALYDSATTVSLTANPSTGYRFGSWSGDAVGTISPISVIMNSNKNITATFLQNTFIITATAGANGSIIPSGDVSVTYGANQSFAITPNTGYHITDVIVDQTSVGAVATYTFTNVTAPHTISSTFAINTYTLTVNAINGTVLKSPDQQTYNHGTSVQLTATPNTGYSFVNWTGDLIGTTNPVTVLMTSNKNITANFALNPPTITNFTPANGPIGTSVTITGTNFISVTSVKFNGTIATYTVNSLTQITATVPTGATTGSITVTNTAGTGTSSTTFKVGYILTIQIAGSGTVLKNPNYLSYTPGTTVTLTAKPTLALEPLKIVPNTPEPTSWKFDHWEIDLTGTQNPKSIIMNGNKTVKAVFVPVY